MLYDFCLDVQYPLSNQSPEMQVLGGLILYLNQIPHHVITHVEPLPCQAKPVINNLQRSVLFASFP